MGLKENKEIVLRFLDAICVGDFGTVRELMPEDGTWWVGKHLTISGTYRREEFIQLSMDTFKDAAGPFTLEYSAITAEDDRVCLEARSYLALTTGRTYENEYHFLMVVRDGKVISAREHMNTMHFSRIFDAGLD